MAALKVYNLSAIGVDVDSDNMHAPTGGFRQAQNIVPGPATRQASSIVTRNGLAALTTDAMGTGAVLGGIPIPAFAAGNGIASLFIGFGD